MESIDKVESIDQPENTNLDIDKDVSNKIIENELFQETKNNINDIHQEEKEIIDKEVNTTQEVIEETIPTPNEETITTLVEEEAVEAPAQVESTAIVEEEPIITPTIDSDEKLIVETIIIPIKEEKSEILSPTTLVEEVAVEAPVQEESTPVIIEELIEIEEVAEAPVQEESTPIETKEKPIEDVAVEAPVQEESSTPIIIETTTTEETNTLNNNTEEMDNSGVGGTSITKFVESTRPQGRQRTFTIGSTRNTISSTSTTDHNDSTTTTSTTTTSTTTTTQPIAVSSISPTHLSTSPSSQYISTSPKGGISPQSNQLLSNHRDLSPPKSSTNNNNNLPKKKFERVPRQRQVTMHPSIGDEEKPIIVRIGNGDNNQSSQQPQVKRDTHGFVVDEFYDELKEFEKNEEIKAPQKLDKWKSFNEHYKHTGLCSNPKQLHKLLSHGIPHEIRFTLWKIYSGAGEKQRKEEIELFKQQKEERMKSRLNGMGTIRGLNPPTQRKSYYQHLHHIIRTSNRFSTRLQAMPEIDKDIERTFPGHPFFESDEGKRKLTRVLQAYSIRNRKVGYCQSMNIVAGYLLYVVNRNEEDAFWLLSTIVEDYCHNYYSTNLLGAQVDMAVFDHLVKEHLPSLYSHLQHHSVSLALLSTKWFMCLYIGVLPNEIVFRIWDHLFVECGIYGYHKPGQESQWLDSVNGEPPIYKCQGIASYNLLLTGLAILSFLEESLMKVSSTPQILTILSNHVKSILDPKRFFKKYYRWRERINEEAFNELKRVLELSLIDELEQMRKVRDLKSTSRITRFSKNDLEKIWEGFRNLNLGMNTSSRISMGKSLKLDYSIFKKVFSYILPSNSKDIIIQQLFKAFDKNKDGSLDFSELMSGLCILAKGTSEERLKLYFSFFDSDNSGFVSKEEMKLMLYNVYEKIDMDPLAVTQTTIEDYVDMVFTNLGITNDLLSFEDFRQACLSYPRIFHIFMVEQETFSVEDFDDFEDETDNNQPSNNNNDTLDVDAQVVNESDESTSTSKKSSKLNFNSNKPTNPSNSSISKTSTFKSSLIQAIEQAQLENESPKTSTTPSESTSSSSPTNTTEPTLKTSSNDTIINVNSNHSNSPSSSSTNVNNNRLSRAVEPQGQPLSCCKFM